MLRHSIELASCCTNYGRHMWGESLNTMPEKFDVPAYRYIESIPTPTVLENP